MKKILLYVTLVLALISMIITLNSGSVYIFSIDNLINVMASMPRIELTAVADAYSNFSMSLILNIPFIGGALAWIVNIGHAILVLCTMILQALVFVVHLIKNIFLIF